MRSLEGCGERGKGRSEGCGSRHVPVSVAGERFWAAYGELERVRRNSGVARYVFLGCVSSHLQLLFLLNITEDTGLIFLKILQRLLGL